MHPQRSVCSRRLRCRAAACDAAPPPAAPCPSPRRPPRDSTGPPAYYYSTLMAAAGGPPRASRGPYCTMLLLLSTAALAIVPRVAAAAASAAAASSPPGGRPASPCVNSTTAKLPFCDRSKPIEERVADLVARLTLQEKIAQLTTGNGVNGGTGNNAIARMGIPRYDWWSEGTHGVKGSYNAPPHTDFPFPITTAMSFNRSLWTATAQQIAREGRALYNHQGGGLTFWAPVINLARDPRRVSLVSLSAITIVSICLCRLWEP